MQGARESRFLPGFAHAKQGKERAKCEADVAGTLSDRAVEGGKCVAHQIHVDSDMCDIKQLVWDPLGAAGCA